MSRGRGCGLIFEREAADHAYDPRHFREPGGMPVGEIEEPLVVFHPGAQLDDDRSGGAERRRDSPPVFREHQAIQDIIRRGGPGHALGPRWIVEMNMRVDERSSSRIRCPCSVPKERGRHCPERVRENVTSRARQIDHRCPADHVVNRGSSRAQVE